MKGSEFVNLLRKVIREEVRSVVKEELKQALKPVIVESTTKVSKTTAPTAPKKAVPTAKAPKFEGPMAGILAETYQSMLMDPVEDPEAEWPDMNMGGMMSSMVQGQPQPMSQGGVAAMNQEVNMDSLMRDYSHVLKASEQKSQGRY